MNRGAAVRCSRLLIIVVCAALPVAATASGRRGISHLTAVPNASAPPAVPSPGYTKAWIRYSVYRPNASAPTALADEVPFSILDQYYGESWLTYVAADLLDRMRTLAARELMFVGQVDFYDQLELSSLVDTRYPLSVPQRGLPPLVVEEGRTDLYAVQFYGPAKDEWLRALKREGAILVVSVSWNGYFIAATPEMMRTIRTLPYVQWSTPLHPYLKPFPADASFPSSGTLPVMVQFARIADIDAIIARYGLGTRTDYDGEFYAVAYAHGEVTRETVESLLQERSVVAIYDPRGGGGGGGTGGGGSGGGQPGGGVPAIPLFSKGVIFVLALLLAASAIRRIA